MPRCLIGIAVVAILAVPATYLLLLQHSGSIIDGDQGPFTKDYPRKWNVPLRKVHKITEDTLHYDARKLVGQDELASVLPRGGGMLRLGPDGALYSISMFHQLRCLDIIGREIVDRTISQVQKTQLGAPSTLSHHCMNYLRQMILCRADTTLEYAARDHGPHIVSRSVTHTCNDWTAVWTAADENYAQYIDSGTVS